MNIKEYEMLMSAICMRMLGIQLIFDGSGHICGSTILSSVTGNNLDTIKLLNDISEICYKLVKEES